jgi:hypothetical protein
MSQEWLVNMHQYLPTAYLRHDHNGWEMLHLPQNLLGDVGLVAISFIATPCTNPHLPTSTTSSNPYDKRRTQWLPIFSIPAGIQFGDDT